MSKRLTTVEFIEKAKKIHGDKYDYHLVEYINNKSKIKIICNIHGVFEQRPYAHLNNQTCPQCNGSLKKTNNEFIKNSKQKHGDKYDYSLVNYINAKTKVQIICSEHGVFFQTPNNHLQGQGCPKCNNTIRTTTEQFIEKSKIIHGDKYDYSLVKYINNKSKVKIICPEHGIFNQTPNNHLKGHICFKCYKQTLKKSFIRKSQSLHRNKYDYSLIKYIDRHTKVKIICPEHGVFSQTPKLHLKSKGCPLCNKNMKLDNHSFIEKSKNIHGDKYDYSLVNYINTKTKVQIICSEHGVFKQRPNTHLEGSGCPICNESKGEKEIKKFLIENNISFKQEFKFNNCVGKIQKLPFDFYLLEKNMCIEYDGRQHFESIAFFGGEDRLNKQMKTDQIKNDFCLENNIKLLRIRYDENVYEKLNNQMMSEKN